MYTLDMVSKHSKYNGFRYVTTKCIVYNGFWTFSALQKHKENKGIPAFGGSTCAKTSVNITFLSDPKQKWSRMYISRNVFKDSGALEII